MEFINNNNKNNIKKWIQNHALFSSLTIVLSITFIGYSLYQSNVSNTKGGIYKNKSKETQGYLQKQAVEKTDKENNLLPEKQSVIAADGDSCHINPSPACAELVFGESDVKFSDTFVRIMNSAGEKFQTPPAIIIAYMAGIGSLGRTSYLFEEDNEEELKKAFYWGGHIRGCDELDPMEQGPYDWIWNWFDGALVAVNSGGYSAAYVLDEWSNGRSDVASRCNFIDATYVIASHFSQAGGDRCKTPWSNLIDELKLISWGSVLEESYAEDRRYEDGSIEAYFNACR